MKTFGFVNSTITEETPRFDAPVSKALPAKYSYKKILPDAINQGSSPTCVPSSLLTYLNWTCNMKAGKKRDNKVQYLDIFKNSPHDENGMTFVDAFYYLKHEGVKSKCGVLKVNEYALVTSLFGLKTALLTNGPCFAALPVYNTDVTNFWDSHFGSLIGYHAITIVGYDNDGFIIRNSWGKSYGVDGYAHISNDDAKLFHEIWTIFD